MKHKLKYFYNEHIKELVLTFCIGLGIGYGIVVGFKLGLMMFGGLF